MINHSGSLITGGRTLVNVLCDVKKNMQYIYCLVNFVIKESFCMSQVIRNRVGFRARVRYRVTDVFLTS